MKDQLRAQLKEFFKVEFADKILSAMREGHNLDSFNVNPFIISALPIGIFGEASSENIAKILLFPRVLGTSVTTKFGDKMQKLCIEYLGANASSTPGMDIEFIDKTTKKQIMMQLKAGPNTLNSGDVQPIIEKFQSAFRLLRQNRAKKMPIFSIGIIYGTISEISGHYKKINNFSIGVQPTIPIFIGKDFWHRLTGDSDFYTKIIKIFLELFEEEKYSDLFENDLKRLSKEIEKKYFTKGKFDIKKIT
jgi:hypothetical protein